MYPNYQQYPKYEQYRGCNGTEGVVVDPEYGTLVEYSDHDQNDWGFFVNLDDLYDHQLSKNNKYIDNYKKQQKRINYMSSIREVNENRDETQRVEVFRLYSEGVSRRNIERNVDIDIIDDEEFGWYVPDKLPNKPPHKPEQRDMHMQRDMDVRTDKITKININIEYDYDDNNAFMKGCLNTCIVLGLSIGCSIFIVLF